jgi:hypothetical protein
MLTWLAVLLSLFDEALEWCDEPDLDPVVAR